LLSWSISPVRADDTVDINNRPVTPGESAAQCYHDATEHLRKGMWFERAAIQLKEAVRQDTKNPDYHLALGCAYADRAASLGYASGFAAMHEDAVAQYPKDLADWEKAQQDPKNDQYHSAKPLPPPAFTAYTKDDLEIFTLTTPEVVARVSELAKQAQAEWKLGISLEKDDKGRANAEYIQGWGLDILTTYKVVGGGMLETSDAQDAVPGMPSQDDVVKAFEAVTKDDPMQAIYWQSLGDILGPPQANTESADDSSGDQSDNATNSTRSMEAYRHALSLDPKNALLWWYIAQFEVRTDPAKAYDDLNHEITADPTNAYPFYIIAESELKQTRYINNHRENPDVNGGDFLTTEKVDRDMAATLTDQDRRLAANAIFLVEQGNNAPFCHYPVYHPPVPIWVTAAFDYLYRAAFLLPAYAQQRGLARDLCGYADVCALSGDLTSAIDADRDIIGMGKRTIGDWSTQEDWKKGHTLIGQLVGIAIVNIGYTDMIRIAQHYGDPGMAEAAQAESDAFTQQQTDWRNALRQNDIIDQNEYADY
jgi:tetratricopeptide (TPR) repeat protein